MKHAFIGRTLLPFVLAIGSSVIPITAHAQQAGFADNFAVDSTRYSTDSFTDASGLYTVDYRDNALRLSSTGTGTEPGNINLNMAARTDRFMADVTLSSGGTVLKQSSASNSAVYIEGYFYNDTYDTEAQTGREGDIWISLGFRVNESGDRVADYCFSGIDTNGDRQNIGEPGSELCNDLPDAATLPLDTQHKAGIEIDRAAKSVTVSIGGLSRQIALTGNVYKPYRNQQRMQARQFGAPATTVVLVHRIETDTFSDNFSVTQPPINRYRNNYFPASRNLSATDGQATLFATTDDPDDGESAELWLQQSGDYLEAVVTLSSESSFTSGESDVGAIVKLAAYNDVQDGGANGEEGDVEARIQFRTQGNGRRAARYCLVRANDPDYDSVTGLLEDGVECLNIPLLVEFDRAYRVALELDRAAKNPVVRPR